MSKVVISSMFLYSMLNKSALGIIYIFMVLIVLICERTKRW